MRSLSTLLPILLAVIMLQACVKQSTYDELQAKHKATLDRLSAKTQEASDLKVEVQRLETRVAELDAAKTALETKLASALKDKANLQGDVEQMQQALSELERRKAEAEARIAEYRAFLAKFQSLVDEGKLKIKVRDGQLVVELATDVLFASGRAKLSDEGIAAIQEVAAVLATIGDKKFQVEGRTDNVPTNNARFKSNWELAAARAITVVQTMVDSGMPGERISAASFAENRPVKSNDTDAGKAANRRIEIVVVPDLSTLPGYDELQKLGQ